MKRTRKFSLKWRILTIIAAILLVIFVVVHTYLASWLLDYVNRVLAGLNGYQGHAESINIDLYRGAYRINNLVINKEGGKIPAPFVAIKTTDFSLQWSALIHGRIVSSATLVHPVITFAVNQSASQNGAEQDWTKPIKNLMPIDINHVDLQDGSITYRDFSSTPQVNVYIRHLSGVVHNLRNIEEKDHPLPSTLDIKGDTIGDGRMRIHGRMNILKQIPDMNLLLAMENVDLPALDNYSEAYASFTFKSGRFDLYSQIVLKNGQVAGYVKPIATHLSVDILKKANPVQVAWNTAVAAILKIFTNPTKDQFATRADLKGNLSNVSADIWTTLAGIVRNAFISAMSKGFDQTDDKGILKPPDQKEQ